MTTAPGKPQIGDVRMSYEMQPCGPSGRPINGGNHYANANTIDDARAWAATILTADDHLGYTVRSVQIFGQEMVLGYQAWRPVKGGRIVSETIHSERPYPYTAVDLAKRCYETTVLDRYEIVHERRSDGTCQCGDPARQSR